MVSMLVALYVSVIIICYIRRQPLNRLRHTLLRNVLYPVMCSMYLPKAKLIAKYSGVDVAEMVIANCTPGSHVQNFQASRVRCVSAHQSH